MTEIHGLSSGSKRARSRAVNLHESQSPDRGRASPSPITVFSTVRSARRNRTPWQPQRAPPGSVTSQSALISIARERSQEEQVAKVREIAVREAAPRRSLSRCNAGDMTKFAKRPVWVVPACMPQSIMVSLALANVAEQPSC
jgi:hypothetical protein